MEKRLFGTIGSREIFAFTLQNDSGMRAEILNFGGIIRVLEVPLIEGPPIDVVLGYDDLTSYVDDRHYMGVVVGRCANRIRNGRFELQGGRVQLTRNEGEHHLHGGEKGWGKRIWDVDQITGNSITLYYVSPDGEEGYPGKTEVFLKNTLTPDNSLKIKIHIMADKPTLANACSHSYFNLSGSPANDILDHKLLLYSSDFTPVDHALLPTGEIRPVKGTAFDFTEPNYIFKGIERNSDQIQLAQGYDHNFCIRDFDGSMRKCAELHYPDNGLLMEMLTNQPGLQFYSGNHLHQSLKGKNGVPMGSHSGLCLEAQGYPDAIHYDHFPSVVLHPGEEYVNHMEYRFRQLPVKIA